MNHRFRLRVVLPFVGLVLASCPDDAETPIAEGEGEGEGDGQGDCTSTGCPDAQQCGTIFAGGVQPGCFATCNDGAAACTTTSSAPGDCRLIEGFAEPVCRAQVADLERCGNDVNAGCLSPDAFCVAFPEDALFPAGGGICVRGCGLEEDCGDTVGCSRDLEFLVAGEPDPRGICAPLTDSQDDCGRVDGSLILCTSGQVCDRNVVEVTGTCVIGP